VLKCARPSTSGAWSTQICFTGPVAPAIMASRKLTKLRAVDFFCGAGGMSFGLQQAGVQVLAGIDNSPDCRETYLANVEGASYIKHDISTLSASELGRRLKIKAYDDNLIFAGCSPCQFWSKVRTDKTQARRTAHLLKQFQKFITKFHPGFIVVENVPGLYRRKNDSILPSFLTFLDRHKYTYAEGVINANHYGVPQNRMRYLLVATRLANGIHLPEAEVATQLTVSSFIGVANGFPRIPAGHRDSSEFLHTAAALSPKNLRRIAATPQSGGTRAAWQDDEDLQIPAYRSQDHIFRDVYGRMFWDRPAPTITTRFNSFSNGRFGHPDEERAISIREGAALQTFPNDYVFKGPSITSLARQIGNAVPPELARRIGQHFMTIQAHG
jgi:DNA (cytosine-5)-methyltransferase 1